MTDLEAGVSRLKRDLAEARMASTIDNRGHIRLPGYCRELNPDELLNQDAKTRRLGTSRLATRTELVKTVRRHLHRRQKQPQVIKSLFEEK